MKRFFRNAAVTVVFLSGLLALWIAITVFWMKGSVPQLSGTVEVEGPGAPVKIVRDRDGVPHIMAQSRDDALFGLGYVHAQDRLWQMEFQRRTVQGRLSEVAGAAAVLPDRYLRTLGLYRAAEASVSHLSPEALAAFRSYAAGVNAAIPRNGKPLPPEFFMLGVHPDDWRPADSVATLKAISVQLSANAFQEILRLQLLRRMPADKIRGLNPPLPQEALDAYLAYAPKAGTKFADAAAALQALAPNLATIGASNNWVIGGSMTQSGLPMLANDPHLPLTVPGFWYLAHLSWPGGYATGGSVPGVPGIVSGRTANISWGLTTTGADTQDLYWEKIDPENSLAYLTPAGPQRFETRREVIKVRLGNDQEIRIRSTRNGPVLPTDEPRLKALVPEGYVLSLRWPALSGEDRTGETLLRILDAPDASPETIKTIFEPYNAPIQSFVYADTKGHTGLILPGRIPVRDPANRVAGLLPSDGRKASHEWKGYLTGPDAPSWMGGAEAMFVTANNNVVPPDYKPMIAQDFDPEYRATRIRELLSGHLGKHDVDSFRQIQLDAAERFAIDALPGLIALARPGGDDLQPALSLLSGWDRHMTTDAGAPLVFAAWMRSLLQGLFEDEAGDLFRQMWGDRPNFLAAVASGDTDAVKLCDDVRTPVRETCAAIAAQSLRKALQELRDQHGQDMAKWRWGDAHRATFSHTPFGFIPVLSSLFGFSHEIGGGNSTIQRAAYRYSNANPFAAVHGSGYRGIYDMGAEEKSLFMASTGQSGNVFSPFYDNLAPRWARGEYLQVRTNIADIEASAIGTIVLQPASPRAASAR
ncbi:MAG: penicillin acylase family protein [Alphaproteobacteria bacterium]